MMDFSIPLAGMQQAEASLNQTAGRVASMGVTAPGDSADLSAEMIAMLEAKNDFAVNTKVVQADDQVTRSTLNLLG